MLFILSYFTNSVAQCVYSARMRKKDAYSRWLFLIMVILWICGFENLWIVIMVILWVCGDLISSRHFLRVDG